MRFDVLTLFPEMLSQLSTQGVVGRAHRDGRWRLAAWNPRDYTDDPHRTVDDRVYGGGPGMVMRIDPLARALAAIRADRAEEEGARAPLVLLSPAGRRYDQGQAERLAAGGRGAILLCGRYEGIDQRFIDRHVDEQWSLGDFVLSGGELAAMAIMDSAVRLLPGVLNTDASAQQDSFGAALDGLLDCPHYTRPEHHPDGDVPEVLVSGHHARVQRWRREQSLALTAARRPDLLAAARAAGRLTREDERFLASLPADTVPDQG